jgi:hypothetical protein
MHHAGDDRIHQPLTPVHMVNPPRVATNGQPKYLDARHSLYFSDARSSPPAKLSDQWRKTMTSKRKYFVLIALAPIIIGLAGFDSSVSARHRHRYYGDGCCPAPCPVSCPAPCPVACPAPAPVISCPAPAPVISCPAPAPVIWGPAPVVSCPYPTSGFFDRGRFRGRRPWANDWDD